MRKTEGIKFSPPANLTYNMDNSLLAALDPIISRVRQDITAVKRNNKVSRTNDPISKDCLEKHLNGGILRGV